jgi:hypothetical protein
VAERIGGGEVAGGTGEVGLWQWRRVALEEGGMALARRIRITERRRESGLWMWSDERGRIGGEEKGELGQSG